MLQVAIAAALSASAAAQAEGAESTHLTLDDLRSLEEHRAEAEADWIAKQRNSHCMHPRTRGWRVIVGENVMPKVFTLGELKRLNINSIDRRLQYLTPTGQRLDQRSFRILLNGLVEKARERKNSESAA